MTINITQALSALAGNRLVSDQTDTATDPGGFSFAEALAGKTNGSISEPGGDERNTLPLSPEILKEIQQLLTQELAQSGENIQELVGRITELVNNAAVQSNDPVYQKAFASVADVLASLTPKETVSGEEAFLSDSEPIRESRTEKTDKLPLRSDSQEDNLVEDLDLDPDYSAIPVSGVNPQPPPEFIQSEANGGTIPVHETEKSAGKTEEPVSEEEPETPSPQLSPLHLNDWLNPPAETANPLQNISPSHEEAAVSPLITDNSVQNQPAKTAPKSHEQEFHISGNSDMPNEPDDNTITEHLQRQPHNSQTVNNTPQKNTEYNPQAGENQNPIPQSAAAQSTQRQTVTVETTVQTTMETAVEETTVLSGLNGQAQDITVQTAVAREETVSEPAPATQSAEITQAVTEAPVVIKTVSEIQTVWASENLQDLQIIRPEHLTAQDRRLLREGIFTDKLLAQGTDTSKTEQSIKAEFAPHIEAEARSILEKAVTLAVNNIKSAKEPMPEPVNEYVAMRNQGMRIVQKTADFEEVARNLLGESHSQTETEVNLIPRTIESSTAFAQLKEAFESAPVPVHNQIGNEITARLTNSPHGTTEFKMELNPETLGKIVVKLVSEGGKISVEITAERPETAALLQNRTEHLSSALRESGVTLQSCEITSERSENPFNENHSRNSKDEEQENHHRQNDEDENETADFGEFLRDAI